MEQLEYPFTESYKSWDRVKIEWADCPVLEGVRCCSFNPCRKCHHVAKFKERKKNES